MRKKIDKQADMMGNDARMDEMVKSIQGLIEMMYNDKKN